MNDFLSDEELDAMFEDDHQEEQALAQGGAPPGAPPMMPEPVPLYSLALAGPSQPTVQQPPAAPNGPAGLLAKQVGPLPAWAWGLIGLGAAGTGYFFFRGKKVSENPSDGDDSSSASGSVGDILAKAFRPSPSASDGSGSGWEPSRSRFAEQLERYYQRKGHAQHAKVWHDADDAREKGGLKFVSPLVNVQVMNEAVKVDPALTRFCRREGLDPKAHPDGSIGLYPHSSKRGKEWEEYIDALRDDGQKV